MTSRLRVMARAHGATWRELHRWVLRRPWPRPGEAFPYARALTPVLSVFIGLSVVEVVIVDVVLPEACLRTVGLVAGVYGLLWMVGMLAALRLNPHTVDEEGLHVRSGVAATVTVPWQAITAVRSRTQALSGLRTVQVDPEDGAVSLPVAGQTNIEVVLSAAAPLLVGRGNDRPVGAVRLAADDLRALVACLREGMAQRPAAASGEEPR